MKVQLQLTGNRLSPINTYVFNSRTNRRIFQSITMQRTKPSNVIHEIGRASKFPRDFPTSIGLLIRVCELATSRQRLLARLSRFVELRRRLERKLNRKLRRAGDEGNGVNRKRCKGDAREERGCNCARGVKRPKRDGGNLSAEGWQGGRRICECPNASLFSRVTLNK